MDSNIQEWRYEATDGIASVDICSDGSKVVIGTLSKQVVCLNKQGEVLWDQQVQNQAWQVGISSNGQYVAAATGSTRPWDKAGRGIYYFNGDGKLLWFKDLKASSWGFTLSGDGRTIAVGTDTKKLLVFDNKGNLLWEQKAHGFWAYGWVWDTDVSFDGEVILAGAADKRLRFLDRAGVIQATHKARKDIFTVSTSGDGSTIAAGDREGYIYVIDKYGNPLWKTQLEDGIWQVKVTDDGQRIIVGADPKEGHIRVYHLSNNLVWRRFVGGSVTGLDVSKNGQNVAVGTRDGNIIIFDRDGKIRHTAQAEKNIRDIAISASGNLVVAVSMDKLAYGFLFPPQPKSQEQNQPIESITNSKSIPHKTFGQWLRYYRHQTTDEKNSGKYLTQEKLGELLELELEENLDSVTAATVSNWENDIFSISLKRRDRLRGLIRVLHRYNGIKSAQEANILLRSGGYSSLDNKEVTAIFGTKKI